MIRPAAIAGVFGLAFSMHSAPVQKLWEARYDGPAGREDLLFGMTVDAGGRVYVTGSSDNNVNPDPYATVKYDTNGVQQWVARYTGPRAIDSPVAIAVDNQGNVYVTGFSHGTASGYDPDYATVKYAPEGTELWVARYNGNTNSSFTPDNPYAMALSSAGEVYVTGSSASASSGLDFLTLKYATNGAQLWERRYNGFENRADHARAMGLDSAGNIYVGGTSERHDAGYDVVVIKYAPDATEAALSRHASGFFSIEPTVAMKVDGSGNSYVVVAGQGLDGKWRLSVLKVNSAGALLWRSGHRVLREYHQIMVAGAQFDDSDHLCVAATVYQRGTPDYLTVKFDPDGQELWASRFGLHAGLEDHARGIDVDAANNIYVTGLTYPGGNGYQFATVKYGADGRREWVNVTDGTPNTGGSSGSIKVDSANHVYVSGSIGAMGFKDYYTAKYRQTPQSGAPVIVSAPQGQTVLNGGSATLSVTATGNAPLTYIWRQDGQIITGATGSSLMLSNLTFAHVGYYSVEIINSAGTAMSPEAALNVVFAPQIVRDPVSRQVIAGANVELDVVAGGTEPLNYHWRRNGSPMTGATNAMLLLVNVQDDDVAGYDVVVSNAAGSVTSSVAQVTLAPGVEQCFATTKEEPGHWLAFPQFVEIDGQGRAIVAQTAYTGNSNRYSIMQFDTNGAAVWSSLHAFGTNDVNTVLALKTDGAGNVYVGGTSGWNGGSRLALAKYSPAGVLIWQTLHESTNRYEYVSSMAVDAAGNVYLAGSGYLEDNPPDFLIAKFNGSGAQQWSVRYALSEWSSDTASFIDVDGSGGVYVVGLSIDATAKLTTIKYDSAGNVMWLREHECNSSGSAGGLKIDSSGDVIVIGSAADAEGNNDGVTLRYAPDGASRWLAQYSAYVESFDYPYALGLDGAGNIYVAVGSSLPGEPNSGLSVYSTVKYSPAGTELWVASRTEFSGGGGAQSLAVDDEGNSYLVLGRYVDGRGGEFVTHRFDPMGSHVWTAISGRPGELDEYPSGIVLDPDGNPLVAGIGTGLTSEIVLIKYKDRPTPGLPAITQPPRSREVVVGTSVEFSVVATGDAPLGYQWYRDGSLIGGATSASYAIPQASANHAGHYSVEVGNGAGSVRSASAVLSIGVPPAIVREPVGQSVLLGTEVHFHVLAAGTRPLYYQWRYNGTNIAGEIGPRLSLANVQPEHAGSYSVVVSNRVGAIASSGAILSVNANARREWLVTLGVGPAIHARPADMDVDADGNVVVTGQTESSPTRLITAKYDSSGQQLWAMDFDTAGGAYATAMAVGAGGNVYVTGYSWNVSGHSGFTTVKYGPGGSELWARHYHPGQQAVAYDVAVGGDGSVYVTGEASGATRGITTIKYDAEGNQVWIRHHASAQQPAAGRRVRTDSLGDVFVAGTLYTGNSRDVTLVKYGADGQLLWSKIYGDAGLDDVADLALDSGGNAILGVVASDWVTRIATVKYSSAGALVWVAEFGEQYDGEEPAALAVDAQDNIYVTGFVLDGYEYDEEHGYHYPNEDIVTLKYDPAGALQWSARHGGRREDRGFDLDVDGQGGLYVTGYTTAEDGTRDMVVLRYDTNGTRYWMDLLSSSGGYNAFGSVVRSAGTNCAYAAGMTIINGYEQIALLKYTHNSGMGSPLIVTSPQSQMAIAGTTVSFSVNATGESPLVFRWYHRGMLIPNAFGSSLVISGVERTNAGDYRVELTNPFGQVVSANAYLEVKVPARILSGPEDQCIVAGSHAFFRIFYEGDGEVGVLWHRNGTPLANGPPSVSITNAMVQDAGVYSVTVSNEFGSMTARARLVITPQASRVWVAQFNSGSANHDQAAAGTVDAQGNVYITGSSQAGIQTIKMDASGSVVWHRDYSPTNGHAAGAAIAVDEGGSVYVAGSIYTPDAGQDFLTLKYSGSGELLWANRYNHGGHDGARAVGVDPGGNVYVTGEGAANNYGADFVTIKYDSDGNELWVREYVGPDGGDDRPAALAVDSAGNVYIAGYTTEQNTIEYNTQGDYLTLKYDTDGNQLWFARHAGPGAADDRATDIAVDDGGSVYVTGSHSFDYRVNSGTTVYYDYDYATIKYDANGAEQWIAIYSGRRPEPDEAAALEVDSFGNVTVTGSSEHDIVTVRYDSAGVQQWVARLDSGVAYDMGRGLVVDDSGNTYVIGHSGDYGDILTFKLDANGTRVWLARHDGPGGLYGSYDYPVAVGVDNAGNVFVAGSVDSSITSRDYLALKYSPGNGHGSPVILTPPSDRSVTVGGTALFSVTASGAGPLQYQWRRNGIPLAGETNATLQLSSAGFGDAGRYAVAVYNALDCAVSADAFLTVVMPQVIQCIRLERVGSGVRLIVSGPPAQHYRIEGSTDFRSWQTIATIYNATGVCDYTHSSMAPHCFFYRIVKQE